MNEKHLVECADAWTVVHGRKIEKAYISPQDRRDLMNDMWGRMSPAERFVSEQKQLIVMLLGKGVYIKVLRGCPEGFVIFE